MKKIMTLLNKDHPVLQLIYDEELHVVTKITEIYDLRYAPPAIIDSRNTTNRRLINEWWKGRAIPASRHHLNNSFPYLDDTASLLEKNMGLSLSDRYWMADQPHTCRWKDVNFFDNPFSEDLGLITIGEKQQSSDMTENMFSPNSTLNGDLRKKWTIQNGRRILQKSGSGLFNQEPYNEVIASHLHERLLDKKDFVPYWLEGKYSACPNMLGNDEELVPIWDILKNRRKPSSQNDFALCITVCEACGIPKDKTVESLEKMFTCDFLLANSDRHYRNFGLIRDVESLRYTRIAPIYDTGRCLWCDKEELERLSDYEYTAKPFNPNGMKPAEQLKLFHGFEWFDESKLKDFTDEAMEILSRNKHMSEQRKNAVIKGLQRNIDYAADYIREIKQS